MQVGNVECELTGTLRRRREHVSNTRMNIACPWHGIEYDVETGRGRADPRMRLKTYRVLVDGDDIKISW